MNRMDTLISAAAWNDLVLALKRLGPNPPQGEVVEAVVSILWDVEGITLDEDLRAEADQ